MNSYWLCQRRWKSTRCGGLITDECFGSLFCFVSEVSQIHAQERKVRFNQGPI